METLSSGEKVAINMLLRRTIPGRKNRYDDVPENEMSPRLLEKLCLEQGFYQTPELNDKLYAHYHGFPRIDALDKYTGLRALWLEGNAIEKIENLETNVELRCLYLHQNTISKIENLEKLQELDTLNISNNLINKIENLASLPKLNTLQMASNRLKTAADIEELVKCEHLSCLDLSNNQLGEDDDEVEKIFKVLTSMKNLRVLNLQGNPYVSKVDHYRKKTVGHIQDLNHLDDRPVFEDERRACNAWIKGGPQEEKAERARMKQEKDDKEKRNTKAFWDMVNQARAEAKAKRAEKRAAGEDVPPSDDEEEEDKENSPEKGNEVDEAQKKRELELLAPRPISDDINDRGFSDAPVFLQGGIGRQNDPASAAGPPKKATITEIVEEKPAEVSTEKPKAESVDRTAEKEELRRKMREEKDEKKKAAAEGRSKGTESPRGENTQQNSADAHIEVTEVTVAAKNQDEKRTRIVIDCSDDSEDDLEEIDASEASTVVVTEKVAIQSGWEKVEEPKEDEAASAVPTAAKTTTHPQTLESPKVEDQATGTWATKMASATSASEDNAEVPPLEDVTDLDELD